MKKVNMLTKMFSGKPNFSLRNRKLTRRRSISGATPNANNNTSQSGQSAGSNLQKSKTISLLRTNKTTDANLLEISRPSTVSSLAPQQFPLKSASSPSPIKLNGTFNIKVDISMFLSSPENTPNVNDIRGKPEMCLFEVSDSMSCGQLLPKVIDRIIQMTPSNVKRDPNLFYIASVDVNTDTRELRDDVIPLRIIQESNGLVSYFKLLARTGTAIKVYSNNSVPGCEYKTLHIDTRTSCNKVTELVLRAMRVSESIEKFALQAFSPSTGMASRRIPIGQDDLALAALRECGYDFSFVLVREQAPGSEPPRRARLSKSRARLSTEHVRLVDSRSSNDTDLESGTFDLPYIHPVDNILIDGPTISHLQPTDSIISLSGLSFVSVDSNTSSANSMDLRSNNSVFLENPMISMTRNAVGRSHSSPLVEQKSVLYRRQDYVSHIPFATEEQVESLSSNPNPPSSPEEYHTPESNVSPIASPKFLTQPDPIGNNSQRSSPLAFLEFPPPPPIENVSTRNEELNREDDLKDETLTYIVVTPADEDSGNSLHGISNPQLTAPASYPQEDESRGSYPSDTSLTSTGTTPSLHYAPGAPGSLLYNLSSEVSDPQSGRNNSLSLFSIIRDYSVFTVEVTNTGQGLGMSLLDTGSGLLIVQTLIQGGVVQTEGSIKPGDLLVEVNNSLVIDSNKSTVANVIRSCIGSVRLVLARENRLKTSLSVDGFMSNSSDNGEDEIERLNRVLKASKPVLSRLKQKNGVLTQKLTDMQHQEKKLAGEYNVVVKQLQSCESESVALSTAIKGISRTGRFQLKTPLEIEALESIRSEISHFCEEVHVKLKTAKDKLRLAIDQTSDYRCQNEKLSKDFKALQTEFEVEKHNFFKHKDMLEQIQSSTCIDCKVKDREIAKLRSSHNEPSSPDTTPTTQHAFGMCIECANKEKLLEQLDNELTDKMLLIADQEAKLHLLRNRK